MRAFRLIVVVAVAVAFSGCSLARPQYVHTVFFKLKSDATQADRDALVQACNELGEKVPTVKKLDAGPRDNTAVRDVNVKDFDIGLVVYFMDRAGYDAYETHPVHKAFVEKYGPTFENVRVLDFVAK